MFLPVTWMTCTLEIILPCTWCSALVQVLCAVVRCCFTCSGSLRVTQQEGGSQAEREGGLVLYGSSKVVVVQGKML